jgi:iron uptake system component EfeO
MRLTPAQAVQAALGAILLVGLTACGGSDSGTASSGSAGTGSGGATATVTVEATDSACTVSPTTAKAGTVEFQVSNTGSQVNEFYVYAKDGRVLGEVENITPGLSRSLKVDLSQPGTYETACKPGMKGDGIRADFTVAG